MLHMSLRFVTGGQGEEISGLLGTGRRGLRAAPITAGCIVAAHSFSETPAWQRLSAERRFSGRDRPRVDVDTYGAADKV